jgi:hypothetical protein
VRRARLSGILGDQRETEPAADVVVITGRDPATEHMDVVRFREGRVETGVVAPLVEGRPIRGEVVSLRPRKELPIVCDVKVELRVEPSGPTAAATHSGPARVTSNAYRDNWDAIWARRDEADLPS